MKLSECYQLLLAERFTVTSLFNKEKITAAS
jgi:hypothetical protein